MKAATSLVAVAFNSQEGDLMKRLFLLIPVILIGLTATSCAARNYYAPLPPPPPRAEAYGYAPGPGFVFVPGYWRWGGGRYFWVPGNWAHPPRWHGYWVPGRWERSHRGYYWRDGRWR